MSARSSRGGTATPRYVVFELKLKGDSPPFSVTFSLYRPSGNPAGYFTFPRVDSGSVVDTGTGAPALRDGEPAARISGRTTLTGAKGTVTIVFGGFQTNAGRTSVIATGTWRVVRGTRNYATLEARGRFSSSADIAKKVLLKTYSGIAGRG